MSSALLLGTQVPYPHLDTPLLWAQWPHFVLPQLPAQPLSGSPSCQAHCPSEEAAVLQVILDDDIGDGVEHELHVLGVGGAREVRVDLLGVLALVQVLKLRLDVAGCLLVLVGPCGRQNGEDLC